MSEQTKPKMTLEVALDVVPDDLPDGAWWAMLRELTGLDDGDIATGLRELSDEVSDLDKPSGRVVAHPSSTPFLVLTDLGWWVADESKSFWRGPFSELSAATTQLETFKAACDNHHPDDF